MFRNITKVVYRIKSKDKRQYRSNICTIFLKYSRTVRKRHLKVADLQNVSIVPGTLSIRLSCFSSFLLFEETAAQLGPDAVEENAASIVDIVLNSVLHCWSLYRWRNSPLACTSRFPLHSSIYLYMFIYIRRENNERYNVVMMRNTSSIFDSTVWIREDHVFWQMSVAGSVFAIVYTKDDEARNDIRTFHRIFRIETYFSTTTSLYCLFPLVIYTLMTLFTECT